MRLKLIISIIIPAFIIISIALIGTFYIVPLYQSQTEEETSCNQADGLLNLDEKSYLEAKRFSTNPSGMDERYGLTSITPQQKSAILDCGFENLPSLVSDIKEKQVGFFEGVSNHQAKGKISLIEIETGTYLRLINYEIKYVPKTNSDLIVPDFHIFLESDGKEIYLEKLKERVGAKNYVIPSENIDNIDAVVIRNTVVDKSNNYTNFEIVAKASLEKPNWLTPISWLLQKQFSE